MFLILPSLYHKTSHNANQRREAIHRQRVLRLGVLRSENPTGKCPRPKIETMMELNDAVNAQKKFAYILARVL